MSFLIKYGSTNKIGEMGEPFCRKLAVNKNIVRTKNVAETMGETAFMSAGKQLLLKTLKI